MSKFETDKVVGNKNGNDINVDSIEEDIKILENYLKESAYKKADNDFFKSGGWEIVDLTIPLSIEHLLSDYTRQKQINEEHKKENGLLREKVKELEEENNEMKSLFEIQASIAKELEFSEKDKMIKFRGNFYIPDTMTLNAEIGKEKRIELSYVDVSRLLENRIVKS